MFYRGVRGTSRAPAPGSPPGGRRSDKAGQVDRQPDPEAGDMATGTAGAGDVVIMGNWYILSGDCGKLYCGGSWASDCLRSASFIFDRGGGREGNR